MSQHDYSIANASGSAVRADLNNALGAIVTSNSGATKPSTTYAYQIWADTTTTKLKIRNGANNAWFEVGTLDTANLGLMLASFFPNVNSNITASDEELNKLDGAAVTTAELNRLSGLLATAAELNTMQGISSSTTELNLLEGITAIKDEDTMSSNSATALSTQQSIKAYVDTEISTNAPDLTGYASWDDLAQMAIFLVGDNDGVFTVNKIFGIRYAGVGGISNGVWMSTTYTYNDTPSGTAQGEVTQVVTNKHPNRNMRINIAVDWGVNTDDAGQFKVEADSVIVGDAWTYSTGVCTTQSNSNCDNIAAYCTRSNTWTLDISADSSKTLKFFGKINGGSGQYEGIGIKSFTISFNSWVA